MMLTLLKNVSCYSLGVSGQKDILIAFDRIGKILPAGEWTDPEPELIEKIIPCDGLLAFPGLIDSHVHILGGGGERGFGSRISDFDVNDAFQAGVTTLVGLLGADGLTRSLPCLYAKAKALESQGLTTYIYSGSYAIPAVTFTGNIAGDLVLIDKVIGAGEIAISDHRSSAPSVDELLRLASDTHLGGMLGGKAGVLHLHLGDGKAGLEPLLVMLDRSDLPLEMFIPTHTNRNQELFGQAVEYCKSGGYIDLTAGETVGIPVPKAIERLLASGAEMSRVTVSSDGNASDGDAVKKIQALFDDLKSCITDIGLSPEFVFSLASQNVAKFLKLYPQKGVLQAGSDADILLTDKEGSVRMLFCRGKLTLDKHNSI